MWFFVAPNAPKPRADSPKKCVKYTDELNTENKYLEGKKILNKWEEFLIKLSLTDQKLIKLAV